jgi:hypothetical protein
MYLAIGETYAGLLENSLRNTNQSDSIFVLEEAFKSLFEICKGSGGGGVSAEKGAAITISKIIHSAPSSYFNDVFEVVISNILSYLKPDNSKNPFEVRSQTHRMNLAH